MNPDVAPVTFSAGDTVGLDWFTVNSKGLRSGGER